MSNEHLQDALYRLSEARRQLEKAEMADHAGASYLASVQSDKARAQLTRCIQSIELASVAYTKQAAMKRGEEASTIMPPRRTS